MMGAREKFSRLGKSLKSSLFEQPNHLFEAWPWRNTGHTRRGGRCAFRSIFPLPSCLIIAAASEYKSEAVDGGCGGCALSHENTFLFSPYCGGTVAGSRRCSSKDACPAQRDQRTQGEEDGDDVDDGVATAVRLLLLRH